MVSILVLPVSIHRALAAVVEHMQSEKLHIIPRMVLEDDRASTGCYRIRLPITITQARILIGRNFHIEQDP